MRRGENGAGRDKQAFWARSFGDLMMMLLSWGCGRFFENEEAGSGLCAHVMFACVCGYFC